MSKGIRLSSARLATRKITNPTICRIMNGEMKPFNHVGATSNHWNDAWAFTMSLSDSDPACTATAMTASTRGNS